MIFGDNPEQGIVRGTTFLHPPLRFRLDFPTGWQVANSPQQVVAKAPDADVFMMLQLVPQPQGTSVQDDRRRQHAEGRASGSCAASARPSPGSTPTSANTKG